MAKLKLAALEAFKKKSIWLFKLSSECFSSKMYLSVVSVLAQLTWKHFSSTKQINGLREEYNPHNTIIL